MLSYQSSTSRLFSSFLRRQEPSDYACRTMSHGEPKPLPLCFRSGDESGKCFDEYAHIN